MEKKQEALIYVNMAAMTHYNATDFMSNMEDSAMVESLLDDEDDVESEFSAYKTRMIEDGTYYKELDRDQRTI